MKSSSDISCFGVRDGLIKIASTVAARPALPPPNHDDLPPNSVHPPGPWNRCITLFIALASAELSTGGAERLVVDAALGLQARGHKVEIYTSHHDPNHCFEETKDGSLNVNHIKPPAYLPPSLGGKLHVLLAHARQLSLAMHLYRSGRVDDIDVFFVDQVSTCIPLLRVLTGKPVVFYCHFPDKLLARGTYAVGGARKGTSFLKRVYRYPMDWLEETTTRQADIILANSQFTARVSKEHFKSIKQTMRVVYPGINISAYEGEVDYTDPDTNAILSDTPTLLSLNRFEAKKNAALAIQAFAKLKASSKLDKIRLVIAGTISSSTFLPEYPPSTPTGGYDPRLEDNVRTLSSLTDLATSLSLTYTLTAPASALHTLPTFPTLRNTAPAPAPPQPDILFLLNFTTPQRTALLTRPSIRALLYTPANEHFGIVPVEAMACGLPVLACDSGGPTESVVDPAFAVPVLRSTSTSIPQEQEDQDQEHTRTGWLRPPTPDTWALALHDIVSLSEAQRAVLAVRARARARAVFGMEAMARGVEAALREAVGRGEVPVPVWADRGVWNWGAMLVGVVVAYLVGPWMFGSA
ncbi:hypothetical protein H0H81_000873 [Sphagnurus paluster]|uniref:Alpha-1,3/1,6-mannosyltransferase ALG2 n=1 Tax=Sphagnurus paluster TaxID=117069 RepID=A0A9P7GMG7_9AGAR|nr:hypothetical protein H0H81_000873 [Sphagnurus paluster]